MNFAVGQLHKIALVTGGARGIGKNICFKLAKAGYVTIFCDNNITVGNQTVLEAQSQGLLLHFFPIDLKKINQTKSLIPSILSTLGPVDLLINNVRAGKQLSLFEETEENWDDSIDIMLKSAFFLSQSFISQKTKGSIVNIASVAATHIGKESPSYHIAKAGIIQMTRYLATYAACWGIRVNAIAPGFIVQDQHLNRYYGKDNHAYRSIVEKTHPSPLIGSADDVANAVQWLCSEEARFINGITLYLDGGLTIQDPYYVAHKLREPV